MYQLRCVQDLAWVIQSTPLISGEMDEVQWWDASLCQSEYQACAETLRALDQQPAPLLQALQGVKPARIGRYFETLVRFWLMISPNFQCLHAQYPLRSPDKTLGELDFVVRDVRTDAVIHLEVAVKFYLGHGDVHQMQHWHGPNLQDRLDLKYQHLRQRQTQLSRLYPNYLPCVVDQQACLLKGRLFYPAMEQIPHAAFATPGHETGRWYHASVAGSFSPYHRLDKSLWLAPVNDMTLLNHASPPDRDGAYCFVQLDELERESERFFVVPEGFWGRI